MNEAQEKPKKKWYKNRSIIFTLVIAFICVIVAFCYMAIGGVCRPCITSANHYSNAKLRVQNAVTNYSKGHDGALPTLSGSYTNSNCSNCSVIDISALVNESGNEWLMSQSGLNLSANSNDNCGGNSSWGCLNGEHYIWMVNTRGIVYSYCAGAGCATNNSGYQGVWP